MKILVGHCLETLATLPAESVDCVITSPPYWGLRDYGTDGVAWPAVSYSPLAGMPAIDVPEQTASHGLEETLEAFLAHEVAIWREVRRVLKPWGVAWCNMGDSYASHDPGGKRDGEFLNPGGRQSEASRGTRNRAGTYTGGAIPAGNLIGQPWRLAFALQADGWVLRQDCIWAKSSCMPESLNGWRWERCRVKVAASGRVHGQATGDGYHQNAAGSSRPGGGGGYDLATTPHGRADWQPCPGCDKCRDTDGLVLRRGSWRHTSSHEHIFMLAKSGGYFCDAEAVREEAEASSLERYQSPPSPQPMTNAKGRRPADGSAPSNPGTRNPRSVWRIKPQPFPEAHFATFPPGLPERCIAASTSAKGNCSGCGTPWVRVVDHKNAESGREPGASESQTLGWRPSCACDAGEPTPPVVLDPFGGSGTTALQAERMGRRAIICELNEEYAAIARRRLDEGGAPLFCRLENK